MASMFQVDKDKKLVLQEPCIKILNILILDESTNALDKLSEKNILEKILKLKNKTIILITHNHNNLKNFDQIFKIEDKKDLINLTCRRKLQCYKLTSFMKNRNLKNKLKVIKNPASISNEDNPALENELSYLSDMVYPKDVEEDLNEFAKNYSEENDDELNGLYAHYNIVKKNVNANYRNLPEYKEYRK